ncbi:MAG: hypothetical protein FJ387_04640 [Verrucomicrobia bacterium]|nr:hypothetical protein [Verrucomicrobiota bacterium]
MPAGQARSRDREARRARRVLAGVVLFVIALNAALFAQFGLRRAPPDAPRDSPAESGSAGAPKKSVASGRAFTPNSSRQFMNLTDSQKQQVTQWIGQGLQLAEIQKRLETDFGLRCTYMEVKLLIGDLQLVPKDLEPPRPSTLDAPPKGPPGPPAGRPPAARPPGATRPSDPAPALGKVAVKADQIAKPGTVVSGSVTFSDGTKATWALDQFGRLGLAPDQKGYRPSPLDMEEFQGALEQELARLGY